MCFIPEVLKLLPLEDEGVVDLEERFVLSDTCVIDDRFLFRKVLSDLVAVHLNTVSDLEGPLVSLRYENEALIHL